MAAPRTPPVIVVVAGRVRVEIGYATMLGPGTIFGGRFRIVDVIGQGGMAVVYRAAQLSLHGRQRALKVMATPLGRDTSAQTSADLFEREVRLLSSIEHPNVVDIIDSGIEESSRRPWLAMQLLRGKDLQRVLDASGVLPVADVLRVLDQVADALHAVHEAGIVHRDLKPSNIFVRDPLESMQVTLLDFGIAKLIDGSASRAFGTPHISAPEQIEEKPLSRKTDVWAFGLLAFELLTGVAYWEHEGPPGLLVEIVDPSRPLVPASLRATSKGRVLPAGFDDWFAAAVVRDPASRFHTIKAANNALRQALAPRWSASLAIADAVRRPEAKSVGGNERGARVGAQRTFDPSARAPAELEFSRRETDPDRLERARRLLELARGFEASHLSEAIGQLDEAISRGDIGAVREALGSMRACEEAQRARTERGVRDAATLVARAKVDLPRDIAAQARNILVDIVLQARSTMQLAPLEKTNELTVDLEWWSAFSVWVAQCFGVWSERARKVVERCVGDAFDLGQRSLGESLSVPELLSPQVPFPTRLGPFRDPVRLVRGNEESIRRALLDRVQTHIEKAIARHESMLAEWCTSNLESALKVAATWPTRTRTSPIIAEVEAAAADLAS